MGYPNLKAEMARNHFTISDVARAAGKSIPAVSNNINGRGHFDVDQAVAIRDKLFPKLSIDYLFSESPKSAMEQQIRRAT